MGSWLVGMISIELARIMAVRSELDWCNRGTFDEMMKSVSEVSIQCH